LTGCEKEVMLKLRSMKVEYDIDTWTLSDISDKFYLYLIHFPGDKSVNKGDHLVDW
jgi:hypothetical protein